MGSQWLFGLWSFMTWLVYGAVAYLVYKMASNGQLLGKTPAKPKKKKKKKKPKVTAAPAHEVLGVDADASPSEIRQAYQDLMRRYHPDRVANAADELRELAETRSKQINAAYEEMMRRAAN